jgi:magnesium-transporting ATPase (P-type)
MVLADDNFASITNAVEEGRTVYDNIKKAIIFLLPTSAAEAGMIVGAILFGLMLPITPLQILWINMVTAITLGIALAFEPPEADVMQRPPRHPGEPILTPFAIWRIAFVGLLLVFGTFGLFLREYTHDAPTETARTVAVNMLVCFEIVYLFNTRYMTAPALTGKGLFGNRYVLAAAVTVVLLQLLLTYTPPMQYLFETQAIGFGAWGRIIAVAIAVFLIIEIEKWVWRFRNRRVHSP